MRCRTAIIAHQLNGSNDRLPPPQNNVNREAANANNPNVANQQQQTSASSIRSHSDQPTTSPFNLDFNPLHTANLREGVSIHQDANTTSSPHFTYPIQSSHMSAFSRLTNEETNPNATSTTTTSTISVGQPPQEHSRHLPNISNAQQQAANMAALQYMMLLTQNPSASAQQPTLPQASATSPLSAPFLLNAYANRPNPVDTLSLSALSPTVDLSPAAFAGLGPTSERRSSIGGAFPARPPLTPIQTSPLLSPLFNNAVAQQLASPLTPQNPDQNAFAAPHLPTALLNNLSNITASSLINELLQRQHAQTQQQAQLQASLQVLQQAAALATQQQDRTVHPQTVHDEQREREAARLEEIHRIARQSVERPLESNIQTNGFRFRTTEASTSAAGQRIMPMPQSRPSLGQIHSQPGSTSSLHSFASGDRHETRRKSLSETHIPDQPYYPTHFMLGTRILCSSQNATVKNVENMDARDFFEATHMEEENMCICLAIITRIDSTEFSGGTRIIELAFNVQLESHLEKASMKAPAEFPFYEISLGWSSFDPVKTMNLYGLKCRKLTLGDRCIIVLRELDDDTVDEEPRGSDLTETTSTSASYAQRETQMQRDSNMGHSESNIPSTTIFDTAGGIRHPSRESMSVIGDTANASDITGRQMVELVDSNVHSYIPGSSRATRSIGNHENAGNQ